MKKRVCTVLYIIVLFLLSANCVGAQADNNATAENSCKAFVQQFYNWYNSEANKKSDGPSSDLALKYKPSVFSPELLRLLKADAAASSKAKGEVVGLDFDPFLATNAGPSDRYVTGVVSKKGDHFWVQIYGIIAGKKSDKPVVEPELASVKGKWQFVNFHYGKTDIPVNENLVSVLKVLANDRQKYSK